MKCVICQREGCWDVIYSYTEPDRYEKYVNLPNIQRQWRRCSNCGHYQCYRNYDINALKNVYKNGYRSTGFRGESIEKAFNRIMSMPRGKRETAQRLWQFVMWGADETDTILDFGSGLGVWPYELKRNGFSCVTCTEVNKDSLEFINNRIHMPCDKDYTGPEVDILSLVHVLEHFEDPVMFLKDLKKHVKLGGKLFIEVPDASEFSYLAKGHDEFNSCHCHMFSPASLYKVLNNAGYILCDLHCEIYNSRGLSRIQAMAKSL